MLRSGVVVQRLLSFLQAAKLYVLHDADYFEIVGVFRPTNAVAMSNGGTSRKHGAGHDFADHSDFGGVRRILRPERAAGQQRNSHRCKVAVAYDVVLDIAILVRVKAMH